MEATLNHNTLAATPLWKVRLRQTANGVRKNWRLFLENKIGVVGLVIIVFFGLMAIAHPILIRTAQLLPTHNAFTPE